MKNTCLLIFCLTLLFLFSSPTLLYSKPIKIQVELSEPWGYYKPLEGNNQTLYQLAGIWIEIIEQFKKETGLEFQISLAPHARVTQSLKLGKIDMSFLINTELTSTEKKIIYAANMFSVSTVVVSLKENRINTINDLNNARIGVVRGSKNNLVFKDDKTVFIQSYRNHQILVRMLFHKRLDAVVGNSISIPFLINKQNLDPFISYSFVLRKTSAWIQLSPSSKQLYHKDLILRANEKLKSNGSYTRILKKYAIEHQL